MLFLLILFCHMGHSYGHKFEIEIKNCIKKSCYSSDYTRFDSSVVQLMVWQVKSCYLKENSLNQDFSSTLRSNRIGSNMF